jgi:hypothetical protein
MNGTTVQLIAEIVLMGLGIVFLADRLFSVVASRIRGARRTFPAAGRRDAADQLRDVLGATFVVRKVMSLPEYRVFKAAEDVVKDLRNGHRVFSQTCLGEVIRSDDRRAYSAINSKRVDVLIISPAGFPEVVVEYQGGAHYQGDAAARDAVKKEALRRAGVEYVEVFEFQEGAVVRQLIREALDRQAARRTPALRAG